MPRDWDKYYRAQPTLAAFAQRSPRLEPPAFVVRAYAGQIPAGPVLDLAGGTGRNALFLARREYPVTVVEKSGVALERLRREAAAQHLPIQTVGSDLEAADPELPSGPFAAILMSYFLDRPLLPRLSELLDAGGLVLLESFTQAEGERRGSRSRFYWEEGEMLRPPAGLTLRAYGEGWRAHEYRHRRGPSGPSLEYRQRWGPGGPSLAYRAWAVWQKS